MLDLFLGLLLLTSALASLHSKSLMKSGIFFLIFGFLSGLVWVRLGAFDVALVEIILGSAITGFLIFKLVKGFEQKNPKVSTFTRLWALLVSFLSFLFMLFYLPTIERQDRVGSLVFENLHKSGVESAVNAVLLNFRGYDTLLEVGVITLAIFGLLALGLERGGVLLGRCPFKGLFKAFATFCSLLFPIHYLPWNLFCGWCLSRGCPPHRRPRPLSPNKTRFTFKGIYSPSVYDFGAWSLLFGGASLRPFGLWLSHIPP